MPTKIIVRLGNIVKTDVTQSIQAFTKLFAAHGIAITLDAAFLQGLEADFKKFNLGGYQLDGTTEEVAEERFGAVLLAAAIAKVKPEDVIKLPGLIKQWPDTWRTMWNEQCEVTADSIAVARLIVENKDQRIGFVIISETNSVNKRHIDRILNAAGVPLQTVSSLISYSTKRPIEDMLSKFLESTTLGSPRNNYVQLRGNPELISHPVFKRMAQEKEARITAVTSKYAAVRDIVLDSAQLTANSLTAIIQQITLELRRGSSPRTAPLSPTSLATTEPNNGAVSPVLGFSSSA